MAIFLLDTDMLSLHQRNQSRVVAAVDSHATDHPSASADASHAATRVVLPKPAGAEIRVSFDRRPRPRRYDRG